MVDADVIVVGAGLAGLVAAAEAAEAGRRVLLLDQEPEQSLGGQAWWSFGGLFFVDSPEQRRLRVRDSLELAWRDWVSTAGFDRAEDEWPKKWARAYVEWAATEKQPWLAAMGHSVVPVVGWAERGGYDADGPGNSVPRFHITWGTGPGVVEPFEKRVRAAAEAGRLEFRFRHRVDALTTVDGVVTGVSGAILEPSSVAARYAFVPNRRRRVPALRPGGDRHLGRDRRQPRPRARGLAGTPRRRARAPALRRPRARRRPDDRHRREDGGRVGHQPGPDVALRRGHQELEPGLADARHPHPAGAVLALARRDRQAPAAAALPRLRHPRHPATTCSGPGTTTPGSSSPRRSSPRSSRCRAPSRTPT